MNGIFLSDLKRAFLSKWYFASVIAAATTCYVSSREYIDNGVNSVYTVELMLNLGLFKKVIVFFSAIPFVTAFCRDYNSGYFKSLIVRSSERSYAWSNVSVCALSGFSSVFLGCLVYFLILSLFCPARPYETVGVYSALAWNYPVIYVLLLLGIFSLYAVMWTTVGLMLTSVLPDPYIALGSPLIFGYILEEITYGLPTCLNLYKLSHGIAVFKQSPLMNFFYTVCVFTVVIALSGCVFSHFVKRRSRNELV